MTSATMEQVLSDSLSRRRFNLLLLGLGAPKAAGPGTMPGGS